jgi:hypothetical protein
MVASLQNYTISFENCLYFSVLTPTNEVNASQGIPKTISSNAYFCHELSKYVTSDVKVGFSL